MSDAPPRTWFCVPEHADLNLIVKDLISLLHEGVGHHDAMDYAALALEHAAGWDTNVDRADAHPMSGLAELLLRRAVRVVEVSS